MSLVRTASAIFLLASSTGAPSLSYAETPWETYLGLPSGKNARLVHEPTYSKPAEAGVSPDRLEVNLRLLANQVHSGDSDSYELALRLRQTPQVDGALAEFLDTTVSEFLRIRPRAFLAGLKRYGSRRCDEAIYTDVDAFADRFPAQACELQQRLAALASVSDAGTQQIRIACQRAVRKTLTEIEQAQAHSK